MAKVSFALCLNSRTSCRLASTDIHQHIFQITRLVYTTNDSVVTSRISQNNYAQNLRCCYKTSMRGDILHSKKELRLYTHIIAGILYASYVRLPLN